MMRPRRSTPDGTVTPPVTDGAEAAGESAIVGGDPETLARAIVLRRLTRAPQTRAQLAEALASRGIPDEVAADVLDRMTDVGLVDDAEFAAMYVRSRRATRGLAPRVLAQELRAKGVDELLIRSELDGIDAEADRRLAEELVARRAPQTSGLDPEARRRRLVGMLLRKGYAPGLAFDVVRAALRHEEWLADED